MAPPLGDLYRAAHDRVDDLARSLPLDELARPVPACPGWTVRDVVTHLSALAVEASAGRLSGPPDDATTAAQLADRADRDLDTVLAEWDGVVDTVVAGLESRQMPPNIAMDVLCHEADVHEALGRPAPPADAWTPVAQWMAAGTVRRLDGPGTLVVRSGGDELTGGAGGAPTTAVDVDPYELWRGLFSRRSRNQIRAWDWDGDPATWVERIGVFGPRDDDQPRPASA